MSSEGREGGRERGRGGFLTGGMLASAPAKASDTSAEA